MPLFNEVTSSAASILPDMLIGWEDALTSKTKYFTSMSQREEISGILEYNNPRRLSRQHILIAVLLSYSTDYAINIVASTLNREEALL